MRGCDQRWSWFKPSAHEWLAEGGLLGARLVDDITVDTNIFVHAGNPAVPQFAAAAEFLSNLQASDTVLAHDAGAIFPADDCRSLIVAEYWAHVGPANPARAIITALFLSDRVRPTSITIAAHHAKWLVRNVADARDRTFVRVATNTNSRHLVSHDLVDFTPAVRSVIARRMQVLVVNADSASRKLVDEGVRIDWDET